VNGDPRREEINVIGEAETNKRPLALWLRLEVLGWNCGRGEEVDTQLGLFHRNFRLSARKLIESHLTLNPQALCKSGDALVARAARLPV